MLSLRLGTVKDFHWEFKLVLSYSKPKTFSTSFGEEKERTNAFTLSNQATREAKQNDTKVKRSKIKLKWVNKREF